MQHSNSKARVFRTGTDTDTWLFHIISRTPSFRASPFSYRHRTSAKPFHLHVTSSGETAGTLHFSPSPISQGGSQPGGSQLLPSVNARKHHSLACASADELSQYVDLLTEAAAGSCLGSTTRWSDASAGLYNLKALIKAIRSCKTLADERALIQKESASIRTAFKDEDPLARHNNIAKLLYIHMLGYPAHFGQIECLKLVATPRFTDKRLGYLGIMLLLDENTEVLTLVTNGLKNDMEHSNMYVCGLALCTFANIASEEMSRDLCNEIEKLMAAATRTFAARLPSAPCALSAKYLISSITLLTAQSSCSQTRTMVFCFARSRSPSRSAAKTQRHCRTTDVPCPFSCNTSSRLSPRLLARTRCLGYYRPFPPSQDPSPSSHPRQGERPGIRNHERYPRSSRYQHGASKNVGNSILYETVLAILEIDADNGLRVMAINILGKFLSNRDNNIRYVALNTLSKVVSMDTNAVQRHRNIILDCLRDGDISIRRRALELSYALINESNVRVLTRELLSFPRGSR